jgi:hypothetical protein
MTPAKSELIPSGQAAAGPGRSAALAAAAVTLTAIMGAGLYLWIRYGTTVFFEMVASGIAACF